MKIRLTYVAKLGKLGSGTSSDAVHVQTLGDGKYEKGVEV